LRSSGELVGVKRHLLVPVLAGVLAAVAAGLAGCSKGSPPPATIGTGLPTTTTSGTGGPQSSSPAPTTPAQQLIEFTTDGAGPYAMGSTLTHLQQAEPGLDQVGPMEGCPANMSAHGVGVWRDIQLFFHADGRLYLLLNKSLSIPTPSGAYLGTTLADKGSQKGLRTIYAGLVTFELPQGNPKAFLVQTLNGGGILFELNENQEVTGMYAGQSFFLRSTYPTGNPLC
jgi:hypothetical protein